MERLATRPNVTAPIGLLLAGAVSVHASLGLLINRGQTEIGWGFAALAAGLLLAGTFLFFAPRGWGLLLHWIGLLIAAGGLVWAAASGYDARTGADLYTLVTTAFALAIGWNTWYALQWWLGGRPHAFVRRIAIGHFVAAAASLAYIPIELADKEYLFLVDDGVSGLGFFLAGFFHFRFFRELSEQENKPKAEERFARG